MSTELFFLKLLYMSITINQKALSLIRIIVALLFIFSGILKIIDVASFSRTISTFGFNNIKFLAPLISVVEFIVGISLLLNIYTKKSSILLLSFTLIFTGAYLYAKYNSGVTDCGCFGNIDFLNTNTIFRNLIISVLLLLIIKYYKPNTQFPKWKSDLLFVLFFISVFITGISSNYYIPKLITTKSNIKTTNEINKYLSTQIQEKNKTNLFFIFSPNCIHCVNSIANLNQYESYLDNMCVTGFIRDSDTSNFLDLKTKINIDFKVKTLPDSIITTLTDAFPSTFIKLNENNKPINLKGSLPNFLYIKKIINHEKNPVAEQV